MPLISNKNVKREALIMSFIQYQQQYMEERMGTDWSTSGITINCGPKGNFAEETAFCSFIYAGIKWLFS